MIQANNNHQQEAYYQHDTMIRASRNKFIHKFRKVSRKQLFIWCIL